MFDIDLQESYDDRKIEIKKVGIKNLAQPVMVKVGDELVHTIGEISVSITLSAEKKGIHMS